MTTKVTTLTPEEDLVRAEGIMSKGRVRHLPVVRDGELLGLVSHRDLLRAQIETVVALQKADDRQVLSLPAAERMRRNVVTVSPDTPIPDAARAMLANKIGCLPVVENNKLVGIVTESDFVRWSLSSG